MFFFHSLGGYSLKEPDEGRYAEIPREMVELNDYVVPHLNYVRYFEKPPLFYWAVAISYKIFGINEWSFRFPCALSGFLCVLALYFMSRRWFNEGVAFLSSLILMSTFGFFSMARIVTLDMFFTLWLFLSLLFFYGHYREKKPILIYLFYVCLALATLTKGIVALILLGITILIFLITEKNIGFLKELRLVRGLAIYMIITLPWFIAISIKEKEFFYFFFIDQQILRFITTKHKRTGNIFYFLPVLFGGFFPWSVFIPRSIAGTWARKDLRIFLIWSFVVLLFFSLSRSKLPPYILPIFPSVAIIVGYLFHERRSVPAGKIWEIAPYILMFLSIITIPFFYNTNFFNELVSDISGEAPTIIMELRGFFISIALTSFFILAYLVLPLRSKKYNTIFSLLLVFSFAFIFLLMLNTSTLDKLNTTKHLAEVLNTKKERHEPVINYGGFDETLPFYIRQRIIVASYKGELAMGAAYDDAKEYFINEDGFKKIARSDKKAFFVVKEKRLAQLREGIFKDLHIITCLNERCLFTNHQ